jgi:hypothetical protein
VVGFCCLRSRVRGVFSSSAGMNCPRRSASRFRGGSSFGLYFSAWGHPALSPENLPAIVYN